ncbi:hypothetical protein CL653_00170 [bacterium]|nr:hypothetical protein [bacterium]|tara:strand:+ start:819 stop:1382 length:564 start_codon:yes stop_codon:yes gene_type:complete
MTDVKIFQTKRICLSFAWYDLWLGVFVDKQNHKLYICPLPTILITINLENRTTNSERAITKINKMIARLPSMEEANKVFDGQHTFGEVYQHRVILYLVLCMFLQEQGYCVWRSRLHDDKSFIEGYFILGVNKKEGEQITYHIKNHYWDSTGFAHTLDVAPKYDGHMSRDVVTRLFDILESEKVKITD